MYRGNILPTLPMKVEHRGLYYCVAENGVAPNARHGIDVEVVFIPIISVPNLRVGQALNYGMDLECHIDAYPVPNIEWFYKGVKLSNNQHYK